MLRAACIEPAYLGSVGNRGERERDRASAWAPPAQRTVATRKEHQEKQCCKGSSQTWPKLTSASHEGCKLHYSVRNGFVPVSAARSDTYT